MSFQLESVKNREQRTENREQRTENREQRILIYDLHCLTNFIHRD